MSLLPGTDRASTHGSSRGWVLHDQVNAGEICQTRSKHSRPKANRQFIEAGNRAVWDHHTVADNESWNDERGQGDYVLELHLRLCRERAVRSLRVRCRLAGTNDLVTKSTTV